jgi:hypothetical protein
MYLEVFESLHFVSSYSPVPKPHYNLLCWLFQSQICFWKETGSLMCYCSYHNINACLLLVHNDLNLHVNVEPFVNSIETLKYLRVMELNLLLKTFLMLHVSRLVVKWLWLGEHTNTLWIAIRGLILVFFLVSVFPFFFLHRNY